MISPADKYILFIPPVMYMSNKTPSLTTLYHAKWKIPSHCPKRPMRNCGHSTVYLVILVNL